MNAYYAPQYVQINTLGGSDVLIQAAGHTISGYGQINAGLINQGLVNANVNGDALSLATSAMTNSALMEATAGGVLSVSTTVNNAGGTVLAAPAASSRSARRPAQWRHAPG